VPRITWYARLHRIGIRVPPERNAFTNPLWNVCSKYKRSTWKTAAAVPPSPNQAPLPAVGAVGAAASRILWLMPLTAAANG
jgi:hypothetical protein